MSDEKQKPIFEVKCGDDWEHRDISAIGPGDVFRVFNGAEYSKLAVCTGVNQKDGKPQLEYAPYVVPESWAPHPAELNVEMIPRPRINWECRNTACRKPCISYEPGLFEALKAGRTPTIQAPCCGKAYKLTQTLIVQKNGHGKVGPSLKRMLQ